MTILTLTQMKEIVDNGSTITIKLDGKEDVVAEKHCFHCGRVPDLEAFR